MPRSDARWGAAAGSILLTACGGADEGLEPVEPAPLPALDMSPLGGGVAEGELALTLGDPVRAIPILQSVPQTDDTYDYAQELLEEAHLDTDGIVDTWVADFERLAKQGGISAARARAQALLDGFPLRSEQRDAVVAELHKLDLALAASRASLGDTDKQVRDLLLSHDFQSAMTTLRSHLPVAWDVDRVRALDWERMLVAADLRYREAQNEGIVGKEERHRRRRQGKAVASASSSAAGKPGAEAAPEPVANERDGKVGELLKQAKVQAERNAHFNAILAYEDVLRLDPKNGEASAALGALAPRRQQLIKELLAKADQSFLRQDLESAVPYYAKVLQLQPDNKQAAERLKMHENLQKIRQGAKK